MNMLKKIFGIFFIILCISGTAVSYAEEDEIIVNVHDLDSSTGRYYERITVSDTWVSPGSIPDYLEGHTYVEATNTVGNAGSFNVSDLQAGTYKVYYFRCVHADDDPAAKIEVFRDGASVDVQTFDLTKSRGWTPIGTYTLYGDGALGLQITKMTPNKYLRVSAIKIVKQPDETNYSPDITVDNIVINGAPETGNTLTVNAEFSDNTDMDKVRYEWQLAEGSADGAFEEIGNGPELLLTNNMTTTRDGTTIRYIRVAVTPYSSEDKYGDTKYSEAVQTAPALGPLGNITSSQHLPFISYTSQDDIFEVDGKKFILLDTTDEDEGKFFILCYDFYGNGAFDSEGGYNAFSLERESNIGYKLNNGYFDPSDTDSFWNKGFSFNGETRKLPQNIKDYIQKDHLWRIEAGAPADGSRKSDYSVSAPLSLLSTTEYKKYSDKIGRMDDFAKQIAKSGAWVLRTPVGDWGGAQHVQVITTDNVGAQYATTSGWDVDYAGLTYRPVFYLSKDFFSSVKIDLQKAGENVRKQLRNVYTAEELSIYSEAEIKNILGMGDYEIKSAAAFKDNQKLSTINGESDFSIVIDIIKKTDSVEYPVILTAVYDEDNMMIGAKKMTVREQTSYTVDFSGLEKAKTARVMIWSGMDDKSPVCEYIEIQ